MCDKNSCGILDRAMDIKTPRNVILSAFYKRSFAYHTVKVRMPVILTRIIDSLARSKEIIGNDFGLQGQNDLKTIIGEISKLKYEIQTDKPIKLISDNLPDSSFYNNYITNRRAEDGNVTHFTTIWLLTECYMYRRIKEAFQNTDSLKNFDPFRDQKKQAYYQAIPLFTELGTYLENLLKNRKRNKDDFINLLKLNLWGNKCDLSISNGIIDMKSKNLFNVDKLDPFLICDHTEKIWKSIEAETEVIIDIILDNSGYELFSDLCLADYLITMEIANKIRIYVKTIPWFISDVMKFDFHWLIKQMANSSDGVLKNLGLRWQKYVNEESFIVIEDAFWTLPIDFNLMRKESPNLYSLLSEAKLAIFKGDLNYRKLFGEKNWDPTTLVDDALQSFHPTNVCSLRTIKSHIICGLNEGLSDELDAKDEKWLEDGNYGVIQFSDIIQLDNTK